MGFNDIWAFQPKTGEWRELQTLDARPVARQSHSAVWSPATNEIIVFGGYGNLGASAFSDVDFDDAWTFQYPTNATMTTTTTTTPQPQPVSITITTTTVTTTAAGTNTALYACG